MSESRRNCLRSELTALYRPQDWISGNIYRSTRSQLGTLERAAINFRIGTRKRRLFPESGELFAKAPRRSQGFSLISPFTTRGNGFDVISFIISSLQAAWRRPFHVSASPPPRDRLPLDSIEPSCSPDTPLPFNKIKYPCSIFSWSAFRQSLLN